jgi:hypothetical protein
MKPNLPFSVFLMNIQKFTLQTAIAILLASVPAAYAAQPIVLGALIQPEKGKHPQYISSVADAITIIGNYTNLTGGAVPKIVSIGGTWTHNGVWNSPNRGGMDGIRKFGAVPMITWQSCESSNFHANVYPLAKIADGVYDSHIKTYATECKNWGHPILMRFDHEMTGDWYPWSTDPKSKYGNTPTNYVRAWRHVHDLFAGVGATNVLWVWCPGWKPETFAASFPGDAYVDWLALDSYNWGTGFYPHQNGVWETFAKVAAKDYNAIAKLSTKPIILTEFSCEEQGGDKGAWIKESMMNTIPTLFPRIEAVLWFQWNMRPGEGDWRINSSENSLTNFQAAAASPLYSGTLAPDCKKRAQTP